MLRGIFDAAGAVRGLVVRIFAKQILNSRVRRPLTVLDRSLVSFQLGNGVGRGSTNLSL